MKGNFIHFAPTTVPAIRPQRHVIRQNHGFGGGRGVLLEPKMETLRTNVRPDQPSVVCAAFWILAVAVTSPSW